MLQPTVTNEIKLIINDLNNKLQKCLEKYNLLSKRQFGCLKKASTQHAVFNLSEKM